MAPIPWSYVNSWKCTGCGICCNKFEVVLKFSEWLQVVQKFGVAFTGSGLNRLYLGKKPDGSCIFLNRFGDTWFCGLQNMKPLACKLWPFKIVDKPKYGKPKRAVFNHRGRRFFVYVEQFCPETKWGKPTARMAYRIIPEFIDIALGLREKQFYSTSMPLYDFYPKTRQDYRLV